MRCQKLDPDMHAFTWYHQLDRCKPNNIAWAEGVLSYDFVEGVHPNKWTRVWEEADFALWSGEPKLEVNRDEYIDYCKSRCSLDLSNTYWTIYKHYLTKVRVCHGDFTFANIIKTHLGHVFIDPGHARGLPCRELDEAKMLQSLDGFDEVYRQWAPHHLYPKFPTRPIHWALLATHYARLMHHVKHQPSLDFASQRIIELERMLCAT